MHQNRRWRPGWQIARLILVLVIPIALSATTFAEDPCTKLPDLWFPAPGLILSGGVAAVQFVDPTVVMQGDLVTVTVTVDNFTCGETGPFDVSLYFDGISPETLIETQTTSLLGCEHVILTFTWDTGDVPEGPHDLCVWADSGEVVTEYDEGDNEYCFVVTVIAAPVIEVTKTFVDINAGCHEVGDTLQFRITVKNIGDGSHGPTLALEDLLPAQLNYVVGTLHADVGNASYDLGTGTVHWSGGLAAGEQAVITFDVVIDEATTVPADLANQAVIAWDPDQDGENDAHEPSDDPSTPEADDPTIIAVRDCMGMAGPAIPGTIDAPSLTEWGMITFGILLGGAFVLMLIRRRRLVRIADARGQTS
ncbi:MAG: DUF11 domain-containing protein [Candidatus Bipolaricaulota bacterium]|nr:MAG: DUF11 domain-containing protein [Candidatus Bipolaricaulota bacterium]